MNSLKISVVAALSVSFLCATCDADLTINLIDNTASTTSPSTSGSGTIQNVMAQAASIWESFFANDTTVNLERNITYQWGTLGGDTAAIASVASPVIPIHGSWAITFDNNGFSNPNLANTQFYLDPTPASSTEWTSFAETTADLGGGVINTSRKYSGPTGDAVGHLDLLTIALHEIGHTIGWVGVPDPLTITSPRPYPGTVIHVADHVHTSTDHPDTLLNAILRVGNRILPSGIDILVAAEQSGFSSVTSVPEPNAFLLSAFVTLVVGVGRIAKSRKPAALNLARESHSETNRFRATSQHP